MKRIGSGWQFIAYDLGNGRVLKTRRSLSGRVSFIALCLWRVHWRAPLITFRELRRVDTALYRSWEILQHIPQSLPLLGHQILMDGYSYEQEYAEPLGRYFSRHTLEENKPIIDAYIDLIQSLWRLGIAESVYNFSMNNGVTKDDRVILIDLGELTDAMGDVVHDIETRRWLTFYSYGTLSKELRDYYAQAMSERLTRETLERLWDSN